MATVQQRTPSRLFPQSEYRVLNGDPDQDLDETVEQEYCVYFSKRSRNRREDVTYVRQKSFLLKQGAMTLQLQYYQNFNPPNVHSNTPNMKCLQGNKKTNNQSQGCNFLEYLPKEITFQILRYLTAEQLCKFAGASHAARLFAYDDLLWKNLCLRTWRHCGFLLIADISDYKHTLRAWFNQSSPSGSERLDVNEVMQIFDQNRWRIRFATFKTHEETPSIMHRFSSRFNMRTAECFPTKRVVKYQCAMGEYHLVGVQNAALVEYLIFMLPSPWHRKSFSKIASQPIYNIRHFGLKTARSPRGQHNGEFFRRRGYYLKTLENRKVHITYRYFPTIRFRLYRNHVENRDFIVCQDIFLSSGESVDCYTAYEIVRVGDYQEQREVVQNETLPANPREMMRMGADTPFPPIRPAPETNEGEEQRVSAVSSPPMPPHDRSRALGNQPTLDVSDSSEGETEEDGGGQQ
uniref:F-box domain-containing protein n=1 Tax=Clytia hemisphaerica TaxID=252671 RepID=A0A7M6DQQ2_9CNID